MRFDAKKSGGELVTTCKDCKFFEPIDADKGTCFGHEVPSTRESSQCPMRTFVPK